MGRQIACASRQEREPAGQAPQQRLGCEQPDAGRITVMPSGSSVVVKTYRADGAQAEQPFDLVVAC